MTSFVFLRHKVGYSPECLVDFLGAKTSLGFLNNLFVPRRVHSLVDRDVQPPSNVKKQPNLITVHMPIRPFDEEYPIGRISRYVALDLTKQRRKMLSTVVRTGKGDGTTKRFF